MARIPETELERLKNEISVERLVEASGVELKRGGKDMLGRCPFHEDDTASLVVSPGKNLWLLGSAVWPSNFGSRPTGAKAITSGQQLHRRRQREALGPFRQSLIECCESGRTCAARQVQRISEIKALVERIDRPQDRVPIFEGDVFDARQRPQNAGNVPRGQLIETTHNPLQFQQYGYRDERTFGERGDGGRSLFGGLYVVGIIDEEPRQDVRIQGPHGLPRRERVSSDAGSKSSR